MELIRTVEDMQAVAERARQRGQRLALVPTMGALHAGHVALAEEARRQASHVTVSVFVNPTQFGPSEDFARYPRTLAADLDALATVADGRGVDAVFAPTVEAMYPLGLPPRTSVQIHDLDRHLCGAFRPGHFQGVTTVVTKLLLACRPHVAFFGMKDAQQFFILRRMARELGFGVDVCGLPTVREADGLALSSRNRYLTPEERGQAPVVYRALRIAEEAALAGERRAEALVQAMLLEVGSAPLARVQYAEVVETETLQPVATLIPGQPVLVAAAVFFGGTRLIDNVVVTPPSL